jgi:hypothetical protein
MDTAVSAVLFDGEPIWVILFVFHRCVVASFTVAASQRDDDAVVLLSHSLTPFPSKSRTFRAPTIYP